VVVSTYRMSGAWMAQVVRWVLSQSLAMARVGLGVGVMGLAWEGIATVVGWRRSGFVWDMSDWLSIWVSFFLSFFLFFFFYAGDWVLLWFPVGGKAVCDFL
jgi:hypothetical protein